MSHHLMQIWPVHDAHLPQRWNHYIVYLYNIIYDNHYLLLQTQRRTHIIPAMLVLQIPLPQTFNWKLERQNARFRLSELLQMPGQYLIICFVVLRCCLPVRVIGEMKTCEKKYFHAPHYFPLTGCIHRPLIYHSFHIFTEEMSWYIFPAQQ